MAIDLTFDYILFHNLPKAPIFCGAKGTYVKVVTGFWVLTLMVRFSTNFFLIERSW